MVDGAYGPTLLDLCDVYKSTIKVLSFMIVVRSIASIIGSALGKIKYFIWINQTYHFDFKYF